MELQKFGIKFFFKPNGSYPSRDFIPEFHKWIQTSLVPEHMLIDVIDYSHIPDGPGIMLIAHEGHFSLDKENMQPGILYMRRAELKGSFEERFESVFSTSLHASQMLLDNELGSEMDLSPDSFRFITNDRLLTANNEENRELLSNTIHKILETKHPDSQWLFEDFALEGERLAFSIKFQDETNILGNTLKEG